MPITVKKHAAVFPGSFDPWTNGHLDILSRALRVFDQVIVAVLVNPEKSTLFTAEERLALVQEELREYGERVAVVSFSGLLVEFLKKLGVGVIIRGLRAISDYEYELQMAHMNRNLSDGIETLFLVTREQNSYISSSVVKQVAAFGGNVSNLVPRGVAAALRQKFGTPIGKETDGA